MHSLRTGCQRSVDDFFDPQITLGRSRTAYVHGQDIMLVVCAVIALASAVLALLFLPRRAGQGGAPTAAVPVADEAQQAQLGR